MSPNPEGFLDHFRKKGYHPRSGKHSDALAEEVVRDLVSSCQPMRERAAAGLLVYDLNFTILTGTSEWKVDLVFGKPGLGALRPASLLGVTKQTPSTVQIAVEIKAVMTEHHKNAKNRKRDFEAHHDHVHRYSNQAIAGGLLVINGSDAFQSPLRQLLTIHKNPKGLVQHCVDQFRAVAHRPSTATVGLDAKGAVVVDMDPRWPEATRYLTAKPAPQVGDPLHYDAFIQAICQLYGERFP